MKARHYLHPLNYIFSRRNSQLHNCGNVYYNSKIKDRFFFSKAWFKKLKHIINFSADNVKLWGNPEIKLQFNTKIYNGNIRYVSDLYNYDGTMLSQQDIETIIGTEITLIEYHALYKSIPGYIKDEFRNKLKSVNMSFPIEIHYLTKDNKGTRYLREIFTKSESGAPIFQLIRVTALREFKCLRTNLIIYLLFLLKGRFLVSIWNPKYWLTSCGFLPIIFIGAS